MKIKPAAALVALAAGTGAFGVAEVARAAAPPTAWLHVRVDEPGKDEKVSVNLPLAVVEALLKAAPDTVASHGRVHLGPSGRSLTVADLRAVWKELRASGDGELVTVEADEDERVSVSRRGGLVLIRVDEPRKGGEVDVKVPVALVDALLAGDGEQMDVAAAVAEMRSIRGDVVRVTDEDTAVRVWIDERAPGGGE